jgi:WS/DGAT/MGAT family acyltransferase
VEAAAKVVSAVRAKGESKPPPSADDEVSEKAPLFEAPPTPFNRALTPNRSVAFADVSLEDVKAIKRAFGTTVNDVVLAACCASLRSWLAAHGGLPERPLIATVPVSVRQDGDQDGNRVSVIRVHLPIQSDDPVERLMAINEETTAAKRRHRRGGGSDILKNVAALINNITVPWMATSLIGFYSSRHLADRVPPLWNVIISNIAGPPVPLYTKGARFGRPSMFRRNGLHGAGPRPARHRDRLRERNRSAEGAHRIAPWPTRAPKPSPGRAPS